MRKRVFALLCLMLFLLAGCIDKSQPWQDQSGVWHRHYACRDVASVTYIQVPAARDRAGNIHYISVPHQSHSTQCEYE